MLLIWQEVSRGLQEVDLRRRTKWQELAKKYEPKHCSLPGTSLPDTGNLAVYMRVYTFCVAILLRISLFPLRVCAVAGSAACFRPLTDCVRHGSVRLHYFPPDTELID